MLAKCSAFTVWSAPGAASSPARCSGSNASRAAGCAIDGSARSIRSPEAAVRAALAYLQRGSSATGRVPRLVDARQHRDQHAGVVGPWPAGQRRARTRRSAPISRSNNWPSSVATVEQPIGRAVRRQSTESRARPLAAGPAGRAGAGRADPRGRRRCQGRDSPPHRSACRARRGDRDDQLRLARGAWRMPTGSWCFARVESPASSPRQTSPEATAAAEIARRASHLARLTRKPGRCRRRTAQPRSVAANSVITANLAARCWAAKWHWPSAIAATVRSPGSRRPIRF